MFSTSSAGGATGAETPSDSPPLHLKKTYKTSEKVQPFYTGGHVSVSGAGTLAACPCDEEVKVVNLVTGETLKSFSCDETVTAVALGPDGVSVFGSSRSLWTKWWDVASGECKRSWKAHDGLVTDMCVDPSAGLLSTAGTDRLVRVWDVDGGFCTHSFKGHSGLITRLKFHPLSHMLMLFSASEDCTIRVWDLVTKTCQSVLEKHFSVVTSFDFSPSGWTLFSASRDKVVASWDLRTFKSKSTIAVFEPIEGIVVIPPEKLVPGSKLTKADNTSQISESSKKRDESVHLLTVGEQGIIKIWSVQNGQCVFKEKFSEAAQIDSGREKNSGLTGGFTSAVLLSNPKDKHKIQIMCSTSDQRLLFYEPIIKGSKFEEVSLFKQLVGYNDEITDLRFVGEGETQLAVSTNSEQIRIYDLQTKMFIKSLVGHTDIVLCLDYKFVSTNLSLLASGGKDNTIRLWNLCEHKCAAIGSNHTSSIASLCFSRKKAEFLVSAGSDRTIQLWMLGSFSSEISDPKHQGKTQKNENEDDKLFNLKPSTVIIAHDKDINCLAISPNDAFLCSGSQDKTAKIWKLPSLSLAVNLQGHRKGVWSCAFSPLDRVVATSSGDKTIKLWSISDGSCLKTLEGHTAPVLKTIFLTRGTQVMSAGADGLVKLWNLKTAECVNTFDEHNDKIWAMATNKKEDIVTGGNDSLINFWTDYTLIEEEDAIKKKEDELMHDQELSNALLKEDYFKALKISFKLNRPFKMLSIFQNLFKIQDAESKVEELIAPMSNDELKIFLSYVREWNSNSKYCYISQKAFLSLLRCHSPEKLIQLSSIREVLEGIIPYTERHLARVDRLLRNSYLLDYLLSSMMILKSGEEEEDPAVQKLILLKHHSSSRRKAPEDQQKQQQRPMDTSLKGNLQKWTTLEQPSEEQIVEDVAQEKETEDLQGNKDGEKGNTKMEIEDEVLNSNSVVDLDSKEKAEEEKEERREVSNWEKDEEGVIDADADEPNELPKEDIVKERNEDIKGKKGKAKRVKLKKNPIQSEYAVEMQELANGDRNSTPPPVEITKFLSPTHSSHVSHDESIVQKRKKTKKIKNEADEKASDLASPGARVQTLTSKNVKEKGNKAIKAKHLKRQEILKTMIKKQKGEEDGVLNGKLDTEKSESAAEVWTEIEVKSQPQSKIVQLVEELDNDLSSMHSSNAKIKKGDSNSTAVERKSDNVIGIPKKRKEGSEIKQKNMKRKTTSTKGGKPLKQIKKSE